MGRKKKVKNKLKDIDFMKLTVLVVLFGIVILAVLSPQSLSEIESTFGIKISNIIDYEATLENSNVYENVINVETVETTEFVIYEDKLNIFFLDVGQADASLIIYNDKTMLIDAGNVSDGDKIVDCIKGLGIKKLDYVIGTHIHEDHVGGMYKIVDGIKIDKIYLPYNDKSTTSYYKKLLKSLDVKSMSIEEAVVGDIIKFTDGIDVEIMAVDNDMPEDENDASIVVEVDYKDMEYLFMGDATTKVESSRKWDDIDVLRVGHHGSNTSSSQAFLDEVKPEISIISVGNENSYGLPKEKIIKRLNSIGTNIYRTDMSGTIQLVSDGITNKIYEVDVSFDGNIEE